MLRKVLQIRSVNQIIWFILNNSLTLSKKKSNAEGRFGQGEGFLQGGN